MIKLTEKETRNFWRKVEKTEGCWNWTASLSGQGYGVFAVGYRSPKSKVNHGAHRVSFVLHKGEIPRYVWVLHRCDNRKCVNPEHLFLGDHQDNMADMVQKDRSSRGEKNASAKLKPSDVLWMRELSGRGFSVSDLMGLFSVGQTQVLRIVKGERWKGV